MEQKATQEVGIFKWFLGIPRIIPGIISPTRPDD